MRIKGPGGSTPVDETAPIDETSAVGAGAPASSVEGATAATGAAAAKLADAISAVAAKLRAGEINVDQAVDLLIDDAIERQVGRATDASRELEPKLRELLRGYAAQDPFLAAKIRRLTLAK